MILRPYQVKAAAKLTSCSRGIVVAPARSGKTIIMAEAIRQRLEHGWCLNILWIANTTEQIDQAKAALQILKPYRDQFRCWVRCPAGTAGILFRNVDILIIDECHHAAAPSWTEIIQACTGADKWGTTATDHREDEQWPAVEELIGPVVCRITHEEVGEHRVEAEVRFTISNPERAFVEAVENHMAETEAVERLWQKKKWLCQRLYDPEPEDKIREECLRRATQQAVMSLAIAGNEDRNTLAAEICRDHAAKGDSVLCLVFSIEQGRAIASKIDGAKLVHSKMKASEGKRSDLIEQFRAGILKCLIATSLADEGLDVPCANVLVYACGGRGISKAEDTNGKRRQTARIEQRSSRVLTASNGKESALIYDFFDWQHPFSEGASWTRFSGYRKLGYRVAKCEGMQRNRAEVAK